MPSVDAMPQSNQPPYPSAGERNIMRDPDMPDVPLTDEDVLSLLEGPVKAMRDQAKWLIKILSRNQHIDKDLWLNLRDLAGDVLNTSDLLLCLRCLNLGRVSLGRGQGFDVVACDSCLRLEREL